MFGRFLKGSKSTKLIRRPDGRLIYRRKFTVEKIVGVREKGQVLEYCVKWLGFSDDEKTWEPVENLGQALPLIQAFKEQQAMQGAREGAEVVKEGPPSPPEVAPVKDNGPAPKRAKISDEEVEKEEGNLAVLPPAVEDNGQQGAGKGAAIIQGSSTSTPSEVATKELPGGNGSSPGVTNRNVPMRRANPARNCRKRKGVKQVAPGKSKPNEIEQPPLPPPEDVQEEPQEHPFAVSLDDLMKDDANNPPVFLKRGRLCNVLDYYEVWWEHTQEIEVVYAPYANFVWPAAVIAFYEELYLKNELFLSPYE